MAELDGEPAGFANLETDSGLVDQLFVRPGSGGRGVARSLLLGLDEEAISLRLAALVTPPPNPGGSAGPKPASAP